MLSECVIPTRCFCRRRPSKRKPLNQWKSQVPLLAEKKVYYLVSVSLNWVNFFVCGTCRVHENPVTHGGNVGSWESSMLYVLYYPLLLPLFRLFPPSLPFSLSPLLPPLTLLQKNKKTKTTTSVLRGLRCWCHPTTPLIPSVLSLLDNAALQNVCYRNVESLILHSCDLPIILNSSIIISASACLHSGLLCVWIWPS